MVSVGVSLREEIMLGVVAHFYNPSAWETEAEESP